MLMFVILKIASPGEVKHLSTKFAATDPECG